MGHGGAGAVPRGHQSVLQVGPGPGRLDVADCGQER